ncbi:hypothetical protein CLAFUW4_08114 [Fulvia fulva]|uniref:Copper transport protein n=1 Tax=Passalora fulva TaxID=5499 RepID=A0A9Q8LCD1_PASFU|nr:uncharacterized protein CLAFUR5_08230 [Fulvia fulva]KAK4629517.1 hypothetical protein CLAFUR4_08119 [Fulvia fulva]KAK4630176.1 hypothetical protein CLAFUR0_08114 [Fulvia fulva]UJO14885.1 hypothetical protein CLAFUR5_08230 [Fulvia fulva]WPV12718.1 hypothetical protein CLAFUW4_08114 [Fulvia fulva]WPV27306.1 hypothetical protein CLAFUW7_08114 [Fulvia fulva]
MANHRILVFDLLAPRHRGDDGRVRSHSGGLATIRREARERNRKHSTLSGPVTYDAEESLEAGERSSLLRLGGSVQAGKQKGKVVKAAFYGVQVFYSFFIMLLFMTYNGWIMIAVGVGAFIGYLMFSGSPPTKSAACH